MLRRTIVTLLAALLGAAALAAPAAASRKASASQTRVLTRAIQASPVGGFEDIPTRNYRVTDAKVSTVSRSWATARVEPTARARDSFQPGYFFAVQPAGTRFWIVVDVGSSEVGCGIAPNSVVTDLVGECPPGEGVPGS